MAGALWEMGGWARRVGSLQHEPQFLLHRVMTECLFAEFAANACVIEIARGTPIVYACFIGYDEYAHRRGPRTKEAARKLWELDRMLGRILAAVNALPELGYELYLFGDHGRCETRPAEEVLGESLAESLLGAGVPDGGEAANVRLRAQVGRGVPQRARRARAAQGGRDQRAVHRPLADAGDLATAASRGASA